MALGEEGARQGTLVCGRALAGSPAFAGARRGSITRLSASNACRARERRLHAVAERQPREIVCLARCQQEGIWLPKAATGWIFVLIRLGYALSPRAGPFFYAPVGLGARRWCYRIMRIRFRSEPAP